MPSDVCWLYSMRMEFGCQSSTQGYVSQKPQPQLVLNIPLLGLWRNHSPLEVGSLGLAEALCERACVADACYVARGLESPGLLVQLFLHVLTSPIVSENKLNKKM